MLSRRIATAVFGLPCVIAAIVILPPWAFSVFMLCIIACAVWEYCTMALPQEPYIGKVIVAAAGCIPAVVVLLEANWPLSRFPQGIGLIPLSVVFGIAVLFFYALVSSADPHAGIQKIALAGLGMLYITLPLSYSMLLKALIGGAELLLLLVSVTWVGDTAAYGTGLTMGRRRLCPRISPGKTVEGAIGSCVAAVLTAVVFCRIAMPHVGIGTAMMLGFAMNIANQFGDLSESLLKRAYGRKDSGTLLPGHGGMLDRIDSLLFATPLLYYWSMVLH
ncbi:MAG: phosphatidate cytidylyltransferase [Desulfobacterota bacterium]|nr:phosphatidate cytidylyltransferase [Thermodesulfobacteriota bacterium]